MLGLKNISVSKKGLKKNKQASRKKRAEVKNLNWQKPALALVITGGVFILLLAAWPKEEIFPIENIRLVGIFKHVNEKQITKNLNPLLGDGFFSIGIDEIQAKINRDSWVESVSIRRSWPSGLMIHIKEKTPFARWDADHLISDKGEVFMANPENFQALPVIHGFKGRSIELMDGFKEMKRLLAEYQVDLKEMYEDPKGAIKLVINEDMVVYLGSDEPLEKVKDLLRVYQAHIGTKKEVIEKIDFRYSNGFSIAWKKEYLQNKVIKDAAGVSGNV